MKDFRKYFLSKFPYSISTLDDRIKKMPFMNSLTRYVTKESIDSNMIQVDVFSELMSKRIIYFGEEVSSESVNIAVSQLLYMKSVGNEPIHMYINTPGGEVYSGLALYDTMQLVQKSGIELGTTVLGLAASMGSILLVGGTTGKRSALEHSRILLHQVLSGTGPGSHQATDIEILSKETNILKTELIQILAEKSGKTFDEVWDDCDRDHWLKATDALPGKYGPLGLVDQIITNF